MIDSVALSAVPGCESGRPPQFVRTLPGGRGCNDVKLLQTSEGRFVLRTRHDPLNRPGASALQELCCHRAAARAGFAPPVIAAADDGRWLLMDFVDAPLWQSAGLEKISAIEELGARLGALHSQAETAECGVFDAVALAEAQKKLITDCRADAALQVETLAGQVRQAAEALAEAGTSAVLNHGDLQVSNMLGSPIMLVDWEYAQVADPTYDIACLLTYYPQLAGRLDLLLGAAGLTQDGDRRRLVHQCRLFAALNGLWMLASGIDAG